MILKMFTASSSAFYPQKSRKLNEEVQQSSPRVLKHASNFQEVWEIPKEMLLRPKI